MIKNTITGTFNISTGKYITINDLLKNVYLSFNKTFKEPIYQKSRNGDFQCLNVSNKKLLSTGFKFQHESILDGLNCFHKQEKILEGKRNHEKNKKIIDIFFNSIQKC